MCQGLDISFCQVSQLILVIRLEALRSGISLKVEGTLFLDLYVRVMLDIVVSHN